MIRYFLYFSYDGTAYSGWQLQPNALSVQEVLNKALSTIMRTNIETVAAGRTDAGVHAKEMVAHIDMEQDVADAKQLVRKLNSLLPRDIAVSKLVKVKPDAHARFDALSRKYEYHLILQKNVFLENYAMRLHYGLDFERMNEACQVLFEYTDFTSFSKLHTDVKTNNCNIKLARWEQQGEKWIFTIAADRFLRNMVRAIVGTLLDVGRGKISVNDVRTIVEQKDRCKAGVSVPAKGLYLVEVAYPENIFE